MNMFPHTITIFNKEKTDNRSSYNKTVLQGVLLVDDAGSYNKAHGLNNSDICTIYIPKKSLDKAGNYVDSITYKNLDDKTTKFTFEKGDYVGIGDLSSYDLSINDLKNKVQKLYEITGIADYQFGGLPSLVITAK